jgi:XRE family transcriptional regulator, regulator of sulfur utilization
LATATSFRLKPEAIHELKREDVMLTRRDLIVAGAATALTLAAVAATHARAAVLSSTIFDWQNMTVQQTKVGARRDVVRSPTATLDELEMHITTLNAGETSHPPHQHAAEELLIVKDGTVEALISGEWKRVGQGSVIFQASNQLHTIRNVGTTPATYHVIQWQSPGMLKQKQ